MKKKNWVVFVFVGVVGIFFAAKLSYSQNCGYIGCMTTIDGSVCGPIGSCNSGCIPNGTCSVSNCPITIPCIPQGIPTSTPPPPLPTATPKPCGVLGNKCCGTIPPLYCTRPFIPSNDQHPYADCVCLDPSQLIPPPPGADCESRGTSRCPGYLPNACYGPNYVWCCTDMVACGRAKDLLAELNVLTCNPSTGQMVINGQGIRTALGCIPTNDLNRFAGWILSKVVFVASGIAFLLMAFGAFQVITSAGDPKKAQAGKELITSALSGLLFIILSIFLLKLIGVDILKIPGFTTKPKSSYF